MYAFKRVSEANIFTAITIFCFIYIAEAFFNKGSDAGTFDCDPATNPQKNFTINSQLDGVRSLSFNLISSNNKTDSVCRWVIESNKIETSLLVNRLTLGLDDTLTISGLVKENQTEVLYKGSNLMNPGFVEIKSYHKIELVLDLKKDDGNLVRSFSFQYSLMLPTVLFEPEGELTLTLNQVKSNINPNLRLSPPLSHLDDTVFLLNFLTYPTNYTIVVNNATYDNLKNPLPQYLLTKETVLNLNAHDYNSTESPILIRYWSVTRTCSNNVPLKGDTAFPVPFVSYEEHKKTKLMQALCVQIVQGVKDSQILVDIPEDTSSLLYPQDSLTFYDSNGTIEFSLNQGTLLYFRNIDVFLLKDQYLVIYETPYFSDKPFNQKYVAPKLRVAGNSGKFMVEDGKPLEKTIGDGQAALDNIHVVYSSGLITPGSASAKEIHLEFLSTKVKPGNWSISIYDSEIKDASPIMKLGQFDLLPSVIPIQTGIVKVHFQGPVPSLNLRYSSVDKNNTCAFLSSSSMGPNLRAFDVRGNQSSGVCSWLIPESSAAFTVLSPVLVKIPVNKTLSLTTFSRDGSSVQQFQGPLDKTFIPDIFLTPKSAYQLSIDPSGIDSDDLHVMLEQRNNYLNFSVIIEEQISKIFSMNYPGIYPLGYNQSYYIRGNEQVLMIVEDMSLLANDSFSYLARGADGQTFVPNDLSNFYDPILSLPLLLTFDTKIVDLKGLLQDKSAPTSRGFNIDLMHFSNATELDVSKTNNFTFQVGNYSSSKMALWKLFYEDKSANNSDSILKINVTFVENPKKLNANIKIYDSKSLRKMHAHEALVDANSTDKERRYITSTRMAYIVYNFTEASSNKLDYGVNVSVRFEKCSHSKNYTLSKCKNFDRCITDPMICNGVDDCGDWSDELFCSGNSPPVPTPSPSGGGVSVVVAIFLLMPLGAILGIFGYVYLPNLLARLRNGRYSEFRDLSSVS